MDAALVCLIGVAVEVLLSGLATFSMAWHAKRKRARAARSLEAELRHIVGRLALPTSALATAGSKGGAVPEAVFRQSHAPPSTNENCKLWAIGVLPSSGNFHDVAAPSSCSCEQAQVPGSSAWLATSLQMVE